MHKLLTNERLREIALFAVAGTIGYFVDVAVTILFEPLMGAFLSRIPGLIAAATTTWIINRTFTFKERQSRHTSIGKEYLHYLSLMFAGGVVGYIVYAIALLLLSTGPLSIFIAIAFGSLAGMVVNYLSSRRFVYNKDNS